ncbi:MAG: hypothetical protein QHC67_08795 [Sphingobium sp.]|uniref:hypothetical protein n=1 Tax=Sphingobium sp. TaxID=1912891 RepID=UPI0029A72A63|nr:hypothetical protein [Sphingobium sp.]MDX3909903.1 hypothetical protein [Sphingobium sp.]
MKRLALALLVVAGGAQAAAPQMRLSANPSAVVAAEIAFNRLAQEKGQWTAFRATAAKDAVMFVPEMVNAQLWLKGRKDPPASVKWQPEKVLMSCDGSVGVTSGAWQRPDGSNGYFTTIWRRDDRGRWNWVFDHGDVLKAPRPAPDFITTRLASCPRGMRPPPAPSTGVKPLPPTPGIGASEDGSLKWTSEVRPDKSRRVTVSLRVNDAFETALTDDVAAPAS